MPSPSDSPLPFLFKATTHCPLDRGALPLHKIEGSIRLTERQCSVDMVANVRIVGFEDDCGVLKINTNGDDVLITHSVEGFKTLSLLLLALQRTLRVLFTCRR